MNFPVTINGPQGSVTLDDASQDASTGGAMATLRPEFADGHTVGLIVLPVVGKLSEPGIYIAAYNVALGTADAPIPAGTKGQFSGYEANLDSAQTPADLAPGESSHGFGCTVVTRGGAAADLFDGVRIIEGVAADTFLVDICLVNNVQGGKQVGVRALSAGAYPGFAAFAADGPWTVAMDAAGKALYRVPHIEFADSEGRNTGWGIDGSKADGLRFMFRGQSVARIDSHGNLHIGGKVIQGQ